MLQIVEADETGTPVEAEVQRIVQSALPATRASDEAIRETALDILRYLPARSANEIRYALDIAENTTDMQAREACALAIRYAEPATKEALTALETGRQSQKQAVRDAVKQAIDERKR
jgi:hypothetical protein